MKSIGQSDVTKLLAKIAKLEQQRDDARAKLKKRTNVHGGSKDENRGTWCTPLAWARRVGAWWVDPFSNPRSHIESDRSCQLERGDNGLVAKTPGTYFVNPAHCRCRGAGWIHVNGVDVSCDACGEHVADESTSVFIQPPYEIVLDAIAHYGHTRFCALLRFDPSTQWFAKLYRLSALVCVTRRRIKYEPPPGVKASAQPYPHALFYRRAEDATPAVLRACIAWRTR